MYTIALPIACQLPHILQINPFHTPIPRFNILFNIIIQSTSKNL